MTTIAKLLSAEDILLDLEVADQDQLFLEVGRHMEAAHGLPQEWVARSLARREQVGSTGLGDGFAIPHARVADLKRVLLAYIRLKTAIPFAAPDGQPVAEILVILVPKEACAEHLSLLADATRMFSNHQFRARLLLRKQAQEVKQLFEAWSLPSRFAHFLESNFAGLRVAVGL